MEVAAIIISCISALVAIVALIRGELRWRAERKSDVRVLARHDGMGMDIYSADAIEVEQVIALSVFNYGERAEQVMWTGLESPAGDPLVNDRPKARKIVDTPPPQPRDLVPRSQIAVVFKLGAEAIEEGFVGYAVLGTGEKIYSAPVTPESGLGEIQNMVRGAVEDQPPES